MLLSTSINIILRRYTCYFLRSKINVYWPKDQEVPLKKMCLITGTESVLSPTGQVFSIGQDFLISRSVDINFIVLKKHECPLKYVHLLNIHIKTFIVINKQNVCLFGERQPLCRGRVC